VIEGVNRVQEAPAAQPDEGVTGGIVDKGPADPHSNIALFQTPRPRRPTAQAIKQLEDGRKVRVFKANGEQVDL